MLKRVYLEITDVCNLHCAFCPGTRRAPRFLPREDFETLTDRLRGKTEYLYFHLMGEPLLHPELEDFLRIAGEKGFRVLLTTNGTLLPEHVDMLLRSPALLKTNVSLQSFEANAGGELDEYLDGCLAYAAACVRAGKRCELRLWNRGGLERLNPRIEARLEAAFPKPWKRSREGWKLAETLWLEPGQHFDWPRLEGEDRGESVFCYALRDQIGKRLRRCSVRVRHDPESVEQLGLEYGSDIALFKITQELLRALVCPVIVRSYNRRYPRIDQSHIKGKLCLCCHCRIGPYKR